MRNSSILKSRFWIAGTGRRLIHQHGPQVALTAIYLTASPHSHMSGIYYLPPGTAGDELGIGADEFIRIIRILERERFCQYDRDASVILVLTMLAHQVSRDWKAGDKRIRTIEGHLAALPHSDLIAVFRHRYGMPEGASEGACHPPCEGASEGAWHAGPNPLPVPKPSPNPPNPGRAGNFPPLDENGLDAGEDR